MLAEWVAVGLDSSERQTWGWDMDVPRWYACVGGPSCAGGCSCSTAHHHHLVLKHGRAVPCRLQHVPRSTSRLDAEAQPGSGGPDAQGQYVQVASKQMVGLYISVWVRHTLLPVVRGVQVATVATGFGGYVGNKGEARGRGSQGLHVGAGLGLGGVRGGRHGPAMRQGQAGRGPGRAGAEGSGGKDTERRRARKGTCESGTPDLRVPPPPA